MRLSKAVHPYEHIEEWKNFNETPSPEKKFHSSLNMKDIPNADFEHEKRICEDFEIKNLGEYYDLYVPNNTFLLVNIFGNFRNEFIQI